MEGCMVLSMDTYRITVAVRKRSDLDAPMNIDEAISMVHSLLNQGSMLDVVAVEPQEKQTKEIKWG
jgi:hypothetical protein